MGHCESCYPDPQTNENSIKVKHNIRIIFKLIPAKKVVTNGQSTIIVREWSAVDEESQVAVLSNIMLDHVVGQYGRYSEVSIRFRYDPQTNVKVFQDYLEFRQEMEKFMQELIRQVKQGRLKQKNIIVRFEDGFLKDLSFDESQEQKINLLTSILNQFLCFQPLNSCQFLIFVSMSLKNRRKKIIDMCEEDTQQMLKKLQRQQQRKLQQKMHVAQTQYEPANIKQNGKNKSISSQFIIQRFERVSFKFGQKETIETKITQSIKQKWSQRQSCHGLDRYFQ